MKYLEENFFAFLFLLIGGIYFTTLGYEAFTGAKTIPWFLTTSAKPNIIVLSPRSDEYLYPTYREQQQKLLADYQLCVQLSSKSECSNQYRSKGQFLRSDLKLGARRFRMSIEKRDFQMFWNQVVSIVLILIGLLSLVMPGLVVLAIGSELYDFCSNTYDRVRTGTCNAMSNVGERVRSILKTPK